MKILSVHFLNLNSLKGEQPPLDFTKPPFSDTGLFAITGPTGAGKTTILDAITIALYGCVHRNERDADDCMTYNTGESYSEVEFEVAKKVYRAKWSNRRARGKGDGKIQGAKMELIDAASNTIIISHPVQAVKEKIIEICGLDYKQFIRSVMLCQGDFTRFLKAKENERSELLEKITDTTVYSEISSFVYEKAKKEKATLQSLKEHIGQIEILSEEDINTLTTQKETVQQQVLILQQAQTAAENKISWLKLLNTLQLKIKGQEDEMENVLKQSELRKEDFYKVAIHTRAIGHKAGLAEIEGLKNTIWSISEKLQSLKEKEPQLLQSHSDTETALQQAMREKIATENQLIEALPILDEVIRIDAKLATMQSVLNQSRTYENTLVADQALKQLSKEKAQKDLDECRQRVEQLTDWFGKHSQEDRLNEKLSGFFKELDQYVAQKKQIGIAQDELGDIQKHQQSIVNSITNALQFESGAETNIVELEAEAEKLNQEYNEKTEGKSCDEWQREKELFPTRIVLLQGQKILSEKYVNAIIAITTWREKISEQQENLITEKFTLQNLSSQKEAAEEKLSMLEQIADQQLLLGKYEDDRKLLVEGCPCPLCGSEVHPLVKSYNSKKASEAEQNRQTQKEHCAQLTKDVIGKSTAVTQLERKVTELEGKVADLDLIVKGDLQAFAANNQKLQLSIHIEDTSSIEAALVLEEGGLQKAKEKLDILKTIQQKIEKNKNELSSEQQKLQIVQNDLQMFRERKKDQDTAEEKTRRQIDLLQKVLSQNEVTIVAFLLPHELTFNSGAIEELKAELHKRATDYTQLSVELQKKRSLKATLENELTNAQNILNDVTERLIAQREKVEVEQTAYDRTAGERKRLFGDKEPTEERTRMEHAVQAERKKYEAEEKRLNDLQNQLAVLSSQITDSKTGLDGAEQRFAQHSLAFETQIQLDGFSSIESLQQALMDQKLVATLLAEQRQLEENMVAARRMLENTLQEFNDLTAKKLTEETEEALQQEVEIKKENITVQRKEIWSIDNQIRQNLESQQRFSTIADKIAAQKMEYERWERLSSIIGSADGKKFRTFAQSLTLARLTELANRHLQQFSDRYRLVKEAEKELELQIVDAWQADAMRPVTTLSGGESFLVSLSLALGLSELAGRKTRIDSLFIDEGFGTLDAETLDISISALENLQAGGKMIGIISHVEALKERIGTQIEVKKQPGGWSKIKIKGVSKESGELIKSKTMTFSDDLE